MFYKKICREVFLFSPNASNYVPNFLMDRFTISQGVPERLIFFTGK